MTSIITNISCLVNVREKSQLLKGSELATLPTIENAYLVIEDGIIADYGEMENLIHSAKSFSETFDAGGRFILPGWCDSHTHLVFAGSRENEFVDKINGLSYAEIAAKGGGILNSAARLHHSSEDELFDSAWKRLEEISRMGTTAVEIKSGYGLSVESELKMLRVIRKLQNKSEITIRSTFLGAHAIPAQYKENRQAYIDSILYEMLPVIEKENLADFIDVFCETGFFTPQETEQICNAGKQHGLLPKIHANQLSLSGGTQVGVKVGAISVDHLESMDDDTINTLANSNTIGTLLPTAAFFLRMPFQPARQLINAGCAVALATDYNPGSSPSGNMNLVISMACIQMKMLPQEAINAATINGAYAMGLGETHGSITRGKYSNLILTKPIPSLAYLPYSFGCSHIDKVMVKGEWLH
jgi:imidazolonepropionase